ncbi:MAG: DUF2892 domain-containing protein [Gemmatimonadaceae bacterium]|nr:DUF2892 domain-containing protein [Gloeobacterales cyanobacterium ES-bin-141]
MYRSVQDKKNVGDVERISSLIGGGTMVLYGLTRRNLSGVLLALAGGGLIYRGVTGDSKLYGALGIDTSQVGKQEGNVSVPDNRGIKVEKTVTINKQPEELFRFWRNFENLPGFMKHLEAVRVIDDKNSHWVAKGPAGTKVEWDAEIVDEKVNEMIAWRSLEGADVGNAGSVHFMPAPGGRGTEVKVLINYDPPAGKVGAAILKLFQEEPSQQVDDDLRRFKQVMEAGEVATTSGQSSGRR